MDVLDPELSRVWTKYSSGDQGLLLTQLTGVTFTTDCLRSARGLQVDPRCPACGQLDSRVHRTRDCLRSAQARARLARTIPLDELRPHHWAFGLWDRPDGTLAWQAALETTPWFQSSSPPEPHMQFLFTDGSCLHPKEKRLRLAASSVIQGHSNATHTVRWAGPLPTSRQSSYRAEVYALGVAVRLVCRAFLCCDCEAAVKVARRLLALPSASREAALPSDHRDLWLYFIHGAAHIHPGAVHVRWVRAHRSWKMLTGRERVLAWFNEVADREAKSALALRVTPAYTSLVDKWLQLKQWAVALADFHIAVAKDFVSVRAVEKSLPPAADFEPHGQGPPTGWMSRSPVRRTAVGKFGGSLTGVPAFALGAAVIKQLLQERWQAQRLGQVDTSGKVKNDMVDEVIIGQVLTAGCGQNPARQTALKAGLPETCPAITINKDHGGGAWRGGSKWDGWNPQCRAAVETERERMEFRGFQEKEHWVWEVLGVLRDIGALQRSGVTLRQVCRQRCHRASCVPGDQVCGSGLKALNLAAQAILAGRDVA
eukprot:Skav220333  [mRNA]  locus=scaffold6168:16667:21399:+ [translate_table: standard]